MIALVLTFCWQDLFDDLRRRGAEERAEARLDKERLDLRRPGLLARDARPVDFSHETQADAFDYAQTLRDLYRRNVREEHLNADTSGLDRSRLVDLAYLSPTVYDAYKYYVTLSQLQASQFYDQWSDVEAMAEDLAARRRARARIQNAQGTLFESLRGDPPQEEVAVLDAIPGLDGAMREALREVVGDVVLTRDGVRTDGLKRSGLLEKYESLRQQYAQRWEQAIQSGRPSADLAPPGMPAPSERELRALAVLAEPQRRHAVAAAASAAALAEARMTAHELAEALEAAELLADVDADVAREVARMRAMVEAQARRLEEHAQAQADYTRAAREIFAAGRRAQGELARRWVARRQDPADMLVQVEETPRFGSDPAAEPVWDPSRAGAGGEAGGASGGSPRRWVDGGGWGWFDLPAIRLRFEFEWKDDEGHVRVRVGS